MDGIKTAIVGFLLVCLILPHIIQNRHQYYAAMALFLIGLLLDVLANLLSSPTAFAADKGMYVPGFWRFCQVVTGLIDILVILILVLASGGLTVGELAGNFANAYEVMRRGEEEKEIIIPLPGQLSRQGQPRDREGEEGPKRYVIEDTLPASSSTPTPPPPPAKDDQSVPLA